MVFAKGADGSLSIGWLLLKLVFFLVGSFVFSAIFWWTKGWVEKCCKKRKK